MIPQRRRWYCLALGVFSAGVALGVACDRLPLLAPSESTITLATSSAVLPVNGVTEIIATGSWSKAARLCTTVRS